MKNATIGEAGENVHPLKKSYMLVSNRHVDYEKLTAFEAGAMTIVLVLASAAGTVLSMNVA